MFALAHISDPHLGPLPSVRLRELVSKRILGYANFRRNRGAALGPERLQALVADMKNAAPDHIAVTGDLINIGLGGEIDAARIWLDGLGAPRDVTVVPGNHDAYLPGAIGAFEAAWQPYMAGDAAPDGAPTFPFMRIRGNVAIVGVSTAIATAPFMATGLVQPGEADAIADQLATLGREGFFRVVLIHHPPTSGSTPWHRRLIGASHFRAAVMRSGAELVLHGHNHRTSLAHIPGPAGPIPVIGAPAASMHPRRGLPGGSYFLFRIGEDANGFVCDMVERGVTTEAGGIETMAERRLSLPQASGTRTHA